jgi:hypothetical protein
MADLFDTTVLVDHLRNIATIPPQSGLPQFAVSVITSLEIIQGCQNKRELDQVVQFLDPFPTIQLSPEISSSAQSLLKQYCLSHGLRILDALFAATAITHHRTLVTANTKHFSFIKELKLRPSP